MENSTKLGDMSTTTRITLITLNSLLILLGLLGNGFVLFAALKYSAIDIDRISILLIENLAAADLLIVLIEFVPILVTLIADKWMLGNAFCDIQSYGRFEPFVAEEVIIMTMACYRVHVVLNPPLVPINIMYFYVVVILAWLGPGLNSLVFLVIKPKRHFNPTHLSCTLSCQWPFR